MWATYRRDTCPVAFPVKWVAAVRNVVSMVGGILKGKRAKDEQEARRAVRGLVFPAAQLWLKL